MRLPSEIAALAWEAADTKASERIIGRAYDQAVDDFHRALKETGAYHAAAQRALAGEPREQVRAYLAGYMSGYVGRTADRVIRHRDAFRDAFKGGFDQGAKDQLSAFGATGGRFRLRDPRLLGHMERHAGGMAGAAIGTADQRMLDQAAASAMRGDADAHLDVGYLAATSAFLIPNRGYNDGRATTAQRSVEGKIMKRWAVLGAALEPRQHHVSIEGQTIHYHDLFSLGTVEVMWPHDWDRAGAEEWSFCRHFAEYLPGEGAGIEPWWGEEIGARNQPV